MRTLVAILFMASVETLAPVDLVAEADGPSRR